MMGAFALVWMGTTLVWGQAADPDGAQNGQLTVAAVEEQIKQAESATDVDADLKAALLDLYNKTLTQLKLAEKLSAEVAGGPERDRALREKVKGLKADLAAATSRPTTQKALPDIGSMSDEQILRLLQTRQAELINAEVMLNAEKKTVEDLKVKLKAHADRKASLGKLITESKAKLTKLDEAVAVFKAGESEPAAQAVARKGLLQAQARAARAQIEALEAEQAQLPLRGELLTTQHALALRAAAASEKPIAPLREFVENLAKIRDRREIQRKEAEARAAAGEHPVVGDVIAEDLRLTRLRGGHGDQPGLRQSKQQAAGDLRKMTERLGKLKTVYASITDKVRAVGMTNAVGLLMRQHRSGLPDVEAAREAIEARQETITYVELQRLELKERVEGLADIESHVAGLLADLSDAPQEKRQRVEGLVRKYLASIQKTLAGDGQTEGILALCDQYAAVLNELDLAQAALIAQTEQIADYIDQRILWIRSADPLGAADFSHAGQAAGWLVAPAGWGAVCGALWDDVLEGPVRTALAILALGLLLLGRRPLAKRLARPETSAQSVTASLSSVTLTAMAAMAWPLAMWYVVWRLGQVHSADPLVRALEQGLAMGVVFLLPLCILRGLVARGGSAEVSLRWSSQTATLLRKMTTLAIAVGLPLVIVLGIFQNQPDAAYDASLGRMLHMLILLLAASALGWWFRPGGGLVAQTLGRQRSGLGYRTRWIWYALVVLVPLVLAAQAQRGFYYTSIRLTHRYVMQIWLVVGLVVAQAVLLRWVMLSRQELASQTARARQADADGSDDELDEEARREMLNAVSVQPRRFVKYLIGALLVLGTWAIWADVLPALGFLERFELWTSTYGSDDPTQALPVTLADLLLAVVIVLLTFAASRNLPGMLEILILQRLRVTAGARYAISTISRYLIVVAGVMLGCNALGISWSHVQWLVAALSLGLGFGLQEIFANFVSGLIILFERPVRVGDVVTVGDVTGTVSRIQGRATTIVDLDRKEFIVPNKKFITEELINWSLTDETLRAIIPVGIAYGSDTREAHRLLLKVAADNPRVLADPPPSAMFLCFGASSLDFELRAFVTGFDDFLAVEHELHMAIDAAFREADISVAFPQQDIHIQSLPEGLLPAQPPARQPGGDQ